MLLPGSAQVHHLGFDGPLWCEAPGKANVGGVLPHRDSGWMATDSLDKVSSLSIIRLPKLGLLIMKGRPYVQF